MMRPELNPETDPEVFRNFYWLKEELVTFCHAYSLPKSGKKQELTERIYEFLKSGRVLPVTKKSAYRDSSKHWPLTLESRIPEGYTNDERHRAFFKSVIGDHFTFNVPFMNWMKANHGKTYQDAVSEWNHIIREKKRGKKTTILSQFEYNQYTRDFFQANRGATREAAITCWKYKKSLPGHNRYDESDLVALEQDGI